jgi:Fe-S-cluster containining protein
MTEPLSPSADPNAQAASRASDAASPPQQAPHFLIKYSLTANDGRLNGQIALPVGTMMGLGELAFNALGMGEQLVGMGIAREEKQGRAISCTKGCGACCRQVVPLSPPEAFMMADLFAGTRLPRRNTLALRFTAAAESLRQADLADRLLATPESDEALWELARQYFLLNIPCPFLEDESCSIHPYRPSMCREYLVTSPAGWCRQPFANPIQRVGVSVRLSKSLARECEPQLIPLTLALEWVRGHQAENQRRWDAKIMIERLIELMSEK